MADGVKCPLAPDYFRTKWFFHILLILWTYPGMHLHEQCGFDLNIPFAGKRSEFNNPEKRNVRVSEGSMYQTSEMLL